MKMVGKENKTGERKYVLYTDEHVKEIADNVRLFLDCVDRYDEVFYLRADGECDVDNNKSWVFKTKAEFIEGLKEIAKGEEVEALEAKGVVEGSEVEVYVSTVSSTFGGSAPLDFDLEGYFASVFKIWDE